MRGKRMRKGRASPRVAEMRPEYDFSKGVRGKYAARFTEGSNMIVLDPDMAREFRDSAAVNAALRALCEFLGKLDRGSRGRTSGGRRRSGS